MTVAVILRLLSNDLAHGRAVGRAEIVDTGETMVFKDQQEMLDFILRPPTDVSADPRGALPALHGASQSSDGAEPEAGPLRQAR